MKKLYSVWVGGGEVNENYITDRKEAEQIAAAWIAEGYGDVVITEERLIESPWAFWLGVVLAVAGLVLLGMA